MTDLMALLVVLGWASTKYIVALGFIFYFDYNFWQATFLATGGGMLGVLFFSSFGDMLKSLWQRFFAKQPKTDKLVINAKLRFIVKLRRSYGLAGIAFLTPLVLTVPVGAIVATSIYKNRLQVYTYMLVAFVFWSLLLCGLYFGLNVDLAGSISSLMH